jgi:hypothetical protein
MPVLTRSEFERLAIDAFEAGVDWRTLYPSIADAVREAFPNPVVRGQFMRRLVGLCAAGDTFPRELSDGYGRPLDYELESIR